MVQFQRDRHGDCRRRKKNPADERLFCTCIKFGAIMLALGLLWSKVKESQPPGRSRMIEKLFSGVLCMLTPLGPRYINPSLSQRIYLMWLFRNFPTLPPQVLSLRQQRLIDGLCHEHGFVSLTLQNGLVDAPVLGTLERRPALDVEDDSSDVNAVVSSAVRRLDGLRQRS
jgi:hypothetical protein